MHAHAEHDMVRHCPLTCRQEPPEERTLVIPQGEDKHVSCLMDELKEHFRRSGTLSDAAKEAHKRVSRQGEHPYWLA